MQETDSLSRLLFIMNIIVCDMRFRYCPGPSSTYDLCAPLIWWANPVLWLLVKHFLWCLAYKRSAIATMCVHIIKIPGYATVTHVIHFLKPPSSPPGSASRVLIISYSFLGELNSLVRNLAIGIPPSSTPTSSQKIFAFILKQVTRLLRPSRSSNLSTVVNFSSKSGTLVVQAGSLLPGCHPWLVFQ